MNPQTLPTRRRWWTASVVVSTSVVLLLTLWPDSTVNSANFVPFREHGAAWSCLLRQCSGAVESANFLIKDVIGNVVVFVPIGVTTAGVLRPMSNWRRFGLAVASGFILSLSIETAQLQIATRAADVDDLIFNTLGTAIGAATLVLWRRLAVE